MEQITEQEYKEFMFKIAKASLLLASRNELKSDTITWITEGAGYKIEIEEETDGKPVAEIDIKVFKV